MSSASPLLLIPSITPHESGSREVESGVEKANQAGAALSGILVAAEAVNKQASVAAQASQRLTAAPS
jgi:methyl-accepting chemotaxis protein